MNYALIFILSSCVGALSGAISSLFLLRKLLRRFSLRPSAQLSTEVTQLRSDLDSISVTVKRLHAKYGMRAVRGKRAEESSSVEILPGETRAQWKERMRKRVFGNRSEEA